ncbi:helix-turn-helix transcriptional regulator [Colwellia sp. TT2012]|uniref:helix-turn-helix transcriptional regulator n=1 Tax=Colwellia sp. TT2012 TaxID=1720342 RepID=UPI00070899BD|nr:AraC family transcriptional regulator [Colwellia sp. TT2012]
MAILKAKEYFGVIGHNKNSLNQVCHRLDDKLAFKIIPSIEHIKKLNGSLGALAYVMDCHSELHCYNLEAISRDFSKKSLYILSACISIPMLHHALKLGVKDVFHLPMNNNALTNLLVELNETTDIDCFEQESITSDFMPAIEELISHPLEGLFELIEQHFFDAPSLKQASNSLYLSPSRISHMFKDLCGVGYCQYILCRRLEESEYLLRQENASVTNVSFAVGFSNPSHFCRNFKEHLGLTPTAYIKKELGMELSCLYQRYQKLRMELLPIAKIQQAKNRRLMGLNG